MVTNLVVKNGSNQSGRQNDLAFLIQLHPEINPFTYLICLPIYAITCNLLSIMPLLTLKEGDYVKPDRRSR